MQNDYPLKRGKKRKNKKVKRVHVCPLFLYQSAYVLSDVCDQFTYVLSEEYLLLSTQNMLSAVTYNFSLEKVGLVLGMWKPCPW